MITDLIKDYYENRGLTYPADIWEALGFTTTEIGEVYELLFSRKGGWVRNNPDTKPIFSEEKLAEELGDAIMMLIVAGIVEGVDPLQALVNKVYSKLQKVKEEKKVAVLKGSMTELSEEELDGI